MKDKFCLTGSSFGRLKVLSTCIDFVNGKRTIFYLCECECGKKTKVLRCNLIRGVSTSCGCFFREQNSTHGMAGSKEYIVWLNMKARCNNENNKSYINYGERGISVCDEWLNSFESFYLDMGDVPSENHTIERVDVNGGYCKDNCTWITKGMQVKNRTKQRNNTSGVTGVKICGEGWVAQYVDIDGSRKSKYYSFKKYGYNRALSLAREFRISAIKEMNKKGAGYSKSHGQ